MVCLRIFAAKVVVHVWMLSILIYDTGIRTKGSREVVPEKKRFPSLCFVKSWSPEIYSYIFKDVSYSFRRDVTIFFLTYHVLRVKRCGLKVNRRVYGT